MPEYLVNMKVHKDDRTVSMLITEATVKEAERKGAKLLATPLEQIAEWDILEIIEDKGRVKKDRKFIPVSSKENGVITRVKPSSRCTVSREPEPDVCSIMSQQQGLGVLENNVFIEA